MCRGHNAASRAGVVRVRAGGDAAAGGAGETERWWLRCGSRSSLQRCRLDPDRWPRRERRERGRGEGCRRSEGQGRTPVQPPRKWRREDAPAAALRVGVRTLGTGIIRTHI